LFTSSLAIEQNNFIYGCSVRIQVEEEVVSAYDNFLSRSACLEDIFANSAGNIFYQNKCLLLYTFLAQIFKYFFGFFFLGRKNKYILNICIGGLNVLGYLIYSSKISGWYFYVERWTLNVGRKTHIFFIAVG